MRQGKCVNFGRCGIADRRQIVTTVPGQPLVCPECHRALNVIDQSSGVPPGAWILVGLALLLGFGYVGWRFLQHPTSAGTTAATSDAPASSPPEAAPSSEPTAGNAVLRLHGSDIVGAELAPALAAAFLKAQGAQDILTRSTGADESTVSGTENGKPTSIEIQAQGSATAFKDLASGTCDIGMASRKIQSAEVANLSSLGDMTGPASEHVLGLDGLAVIVNRSNPLSALSKHDIARIFSGNATSWKDVGGSGGVINVFARDAKSGTFDTFQSLVMGGKPLVSSALRIEDSRELAAKVAQDSDAIGFVGLPYVAGAKALAVSENGTKALLPTALTVSTEDYSLSRRVYLYTASNPRNPMVRSFVDFALSKAGQNVVAANGFVEQNVKSQAVNVVAEAPADYKRLTDGAERLSLNFRFRPGSSALDNKALPDLDRVSSFISDLKYSGKDLMLFGFADGTGSKDANCRLSKERAQAVSDQFSQRGLNPVTVSGFCSELAVASNDNEEGREKNRRVEIWLRKH